MSQPCLILRRMHSTTGIRHSWHEILGQMELRYYDISKELPTRRCLFKLRTLCSSVTLSCRPSHSSLFFTTVNVGRGRGGEKESVPRDYYSFHMYGTISVEITRRDNLPFPLNNENIIPIHRQSHTLISCCVCMTKHRHVYFMISCGCPPLFEISSQYPIMVS